MDPALSGDGIATLGLVLDSTAVVIGAMLVSPLMGPILEVGMGFAAGSSVLVLRASLRVLLSIVVVVTCAGLLTLALPFHQVTGEIAARSAPTALDLLVAVFCALTAAYTTVRRTSDTTSAAAGTAIGIALVPPLCTIGFGLGIGSHAIAGGAALLFTANFSAILLFAVMSFLVLGYNQVNAEHIGAASKMSGTTWTDRVAERVESLMQSAFGSRYGIAIRIMIPALFLVAVFVPLRTALTEVTWEVQARDAVRAIVASEAPNAVQTVLSIEKRTVTLQLLVVGSNERAATLEQTMRRRIEEKTDVAPTVRVTAVPDARTLAGALAPRNNLATSTPPARTGVNELRQEVQSALEAAWPASAAGALLGWELHVPMEGTLKIVAYHIGQALGAPGESLLAHAVSGSIGVNVQITDVALASGAVAKPLGRAREWLVEAQPMLTFVEQVGGLFGCVRAPASPTRRLTAEQRTVLATLRASAAAGQSRLTVQDSAGWSMRVATQRCATDSTAAAAR